MPDKNTQPQPQEYDLSTLTVDELDRILDAMAKHQAKEEKREHT